MDTSYEASGPSTTFMGVSREKIPWWPVIDVDKCDGCNREYDCLKFCPHNVYEPRKDISKIEVVNRYNCVLFCTTRSKMCPHDASSFPAKADILKIIEDGRSE
ncbi:MAG: ferredoxin family protein [Candidatus Thorarchaeota archaeon]|nr:MAG: ferredoxin family protein [Candidatus Thorarchaeota archaeon]